MDPIEENVLDDSVSVKNDDSRNDIVTCTNTNEDDFGDTTSLLVIGTQDSVSNVTFEESSEHFPHFREPIDVFGEFGDTNATSCQVEMSQT
ncbi:Aftiphilin [Sciurus carolinensis]|uniref:Aftiphilin n=1 Tax=Sciurus carolinensis TaxID=30640 RepID=A0AA41T1P6_SCICA|nr:Aftiphilin [Sciurus carolinensis]